LLTQLVSKIFKLCGHDRPTSQTDRRTDDMRSQNRALHYSASRGRKARWTYVPFTGAVEGDEKQHSDEYTEHDSKKHRHRHTCSPIHFTPSLHRLALLLVFRCHDIRVSCLFPARISTSYGDLSFGVSGPSTWNSLPAATRSRLLTSLQAVKLLECLWHQ